MSEELQNQPCPYDQQQKLTLDFYETRIKEELQKKTLEGTNYITKVSNKQQRQTTNPEDSDPTSQK